MREENIHSIRKILKRLPDLIDSRMGKLFLAHLESCDSMQKHISHYHKKKNFSLHFTPHIFHTNFSLEKTLDFFYIRRDLQVSMCLFSNLFPRYKTFRHLKIFLIFFPYIILYFKVVFN